MSRKYEHVEYFTMYVVCKYFSNIPSNSEANASRLLEYSEEMFPRY